ncbi:MAG: hypothetical protein COX90_03935 [Candidatus Nealsonbacteria bacterium CG_4_10_14_0_2_um_filter_38_17]|uniref:Aminoglycoside phosphotransferase domain-containing protein n=2 Tax=Candidatus Nealsoniibacteriota TaxID=1817911 RepID=A0A2M7UX37_9BACT|nr:MAG: hypothetical protein COX36_01635 [Candidatus Nealsonbacteria bacterium CG23_combo_of_CG06-09_8_20_14_all_38_19]PIZ88534.1 MAG: hypothetical protein COX90_03935 [Candidatus Nealsonbacteria bacterium CG_4_10_14_0_2_um_filter_38_17]
MILKVGSILISEIDKKIERKLQELNLKPEISPQKFLKIHNVKKHRYFSPCLTAEGGKVAFYGRLHNNLDAKGKFIREIIFLKKIKKANLKIKEIVPKIIDYGIEKDFEWLEREYPKGPPLGHSRNLIQKPFPGMIKKIIKTLFEISKIPPKTFPNLKKFRCQNYLPPLYEEFANKCIIKSDLSKKILKLVKEDLPLIEKENKYFCHGDLNLGNILSEGKDIWIIDWELIHFNNFAYDIGYLWTHLWEAKRSFRQKVLRSYINHLNFQDLLKFKKILPVVTSYFSLQSIKYKEEKEKAAILRKRRRFYLSLLNNCLDFNKLIKV